MTIQLLAGAAGEIIGEAKMFRALVLEKEVDTAVADVRELDDSALPAGDVTVAGLCCTIGVRGFI